MVQINHVETEERTKRSQILDVLSSIELKKKTPGRPHKKFLQTQVSKNLYVIQKPYKVYCSVENRNTFRKL